MRLSRGHSLAAFFLPALLFFGPAAFAPAAASIAPASDDAALAARIESAWRVQQRWESIAKNGSYEYAFELKTWSSAERLKEQIERSARVESRDGVSRTEILSARKDGRDDLAGAREQQREAEGKRARGDGKSKEFPSPFDPKYRAEYAFAAEISKDGRSALSFRPRRRLDGAIAGTAEFDGEGRPRRVAFTLAHAPIFTRNLRFTISLDVQGNPARVESGGEVSLIVWKRRFESTLVVRNVVPP